MRTDENLDDDVKQQSTWQGKTHADAKEDPINQSFSGEERNRWYHNQPGEPGENKERDLVEQSMLSGLDSIADGRAFAIADFNKDGRPDIALCNANAPKLQLFQNQIESEHNFVALRFEGAARAKRANQNTKGQSCRDGYGASVTLKLDNGQVILREFRCGEGFAAQNSDTMLVGIGEAKVVKQVDVRWPSGQQQQTGPISNGQLLNIYEGQEKKRQTQLLIVRIKPISQNNVLPVDCLLGAHIEIDFVIAGCDIGRQFRFPAVMVFCR